MNLNLKEESVYILLSSIDENQETRNLFDISLKFLIFLVLSLDQKAQGVEHGLLVHLKLVLLLPSTTLRSNGLCMMS